MAHFTVNGNENEEHDFWAEKLTQDELDGGATVGEVVQIFSLTSQAENSWELFIWIFPENIPGFYSAQIFLESTGLDVREASDIPNLFVLSQETADPATEILAVASLIQSFILSLEEEMQENWI